jgi:hypothetical protein
VGGDADALDRLQHFGVYVVRYLQGVGALENAEANQLLTLWNHLKPSAIA